jgi:hypothetical protein
MVALVFNECVFLSFFFVAHGSECIGHGIPSPSLLADLKNYLVKIG